MVAALSTTALILVNLKTNTQKHVQECINSS